MVFPGMGTSWPDPTLLLPGPGLANGQADGQPAVWSSSQSCLFLCQKFPDIPVSLEENTEVPGTTSSETLLPLDRDRRFDSPALSGRRSRPSWRTSR